MTVHVLRARSVRPPPHPDHPQQPRLLAGGSRGPGRRRHRLRRAAHRPAAGARPRPPRHPDPRQPRLLPREARDTAEAE